MDNKDTKQRVKEILSKNTENPEVRGLIRSLKSQASTMIDYWDLSGLQLDATIKVWTQIGEKTFKELYKHKQ